jgi:hypothetical protein
MDESNKVAIVQQVVSHPDFEIIYSYKDKKLEKDDTQGQKNLLLSLLSREPSIFLEVKDINDIFISIRDMVNI